MSDGQRDVFVPAVGPILGYDEYCTHCNGFGSSLHDPDDMRYCSKCGGTGKASDCDKTVHPCGPVTS